MDWERLGKAVVGAAKNAADTAVHATVHASKVVAGELQTLGSARCLLPYTIENLITNSYSGWAIYRARSKDPNNPANPPVVAAWILDKRNCSKEHLDASKHEMASLTKIKHPSILRVVSPLEETRQQFVVLTEMITSSVDDVIKGGDRLDELEMKLGLLQLAEALQFLHVNAGLVHAGVCPANVFISAQDGTWKLAGFCFSAPLDYKQPGQHSFDYLDRSALVPPLMYTAPELVLGTGDASATADTFSLALVTIQLLTGQQLLQVYDISGYQSRINSFNIVDLTGLPLALQQTIRTMIAVAPEGRPPVATFAGSTFFANDAGLRALRFLRTMTSRDPTQKCAFLADLPRISAGFSPRVLKQVVLPALLGELRMKETQTSALSFLLDKVLPHMNDGEFTENLLPALENNLNQLVEPSLLALVEQLPLIANTSRNSSAAFVPRVLIQALSSDSIALQQAALEGLVALAGTLDASGLKKLLPVVAHTCAATTNSGVRVTAFKSMAAAAGRASNEEAEGMIDMAQRVLAVDKSPATIMSAVGLGEQLVQQLGAGRFGTERVVPLLSPLLAIGQLNGTQFGTAMRVIRAILDKVEQARGGGGGNITTTTKSQKQQKQQQAIGTSSTAANGSSNRNGGLSSELDMDWRVADQQPQVVVAPSVSSSAYGELDLSVLTMGTSNNNTGAMNFGGSSNTSMRPLVQQQQQPLGGSIDFGDFMSQPANGNAASNRGNNAGSDDLFSLLANQQQAVAPTSSKPKPAPITESLI